LRNERPLGWCHSGGTVTTYEDQTIVSSTRQTPDCESLLELVQQSLENDKAIDIVTIDLAGKTSLADYMVVASGNSSRQVGAMGDHLRRKLRSIGIKGVAVEGEKYCDWVLVDAGDIIIHLFRPEVREFYKIERLWDESLDAFEGDDGNDGGPDTAESAIAP
jgi:ribosome-associated protein